MTLIEGLTDATTKDLMDRRAALEAELLQMRRVSVFATRAGAHERVAQSMAALEDAIAARVARARYHLSSTSSPLPPELLAELAALIQARTVDGVIHEAIDAPPGPGEADPWRDDVFERREEATAELDMVSAELELRLLKEEAAELDGKRRQVLDRIKGRR